MSIILASQMIGIAFACGLNLYATVALLGIALRLDWTGAFSPGMAGLEHGIVIGSAAALYAVEFIIDRIPLVDHVWEGAHTLIRPAAAGLLAALALQASPVWVQLAGGTAAAAVALAAHGTKAGLRVILSARAAWLRRRRRHAFMRIGLSLVEDMAAVGIVVLVLVVPETAIRALAVAALVLLVAVPRLWRASALGLRALRARSAGFFGERRWRQRHQLPRVIRDAIPGEPLGRSPARVAPAAVSGLPGVGEFRNGWLVFTCDGASFLYRSFFRTRTAELPRAADVRVRRGLVTDALDLVAVGNGAGPARPVTIFLLKDGPPPQIAAAALRADLVPDPG